MLCYLLRQILPYNGYTFKCEALLASACVRYLYVISIADKSLSTYITKFRQKSYSLINSLFRVFNTRNKNTIITLYKLYVRHKIM